MCGTGLRMTWPRRPPSAAVMSPVTLFGACGSPEVARLLALCSRVHLMKMVQGNGERLSGCWAALVVVHACMVFGGVMTSVWNARFLFPTSRVRSECWSGFVFDMLNRRSNPPETGLAPDPILTVDDWANRHRMLVGGPAEPGRWSTSRTPCLKAGDGNAVCHLPARGARGADGRGANRQTEAGLNWLGYGFTTPGADAAGAAHGGRRQRVSKQRVDALIEASPELAGRVKDPRRAIRATPS